MVKNEFKEAFKIASDMTIDLSKDVDPQIFGYGLKDFSPIHTTIRAVAAEIRWHGLMLNGTWDMEMVNEVGMLGKKKFLIIG